MSVIICIPYNYFIINRIALIEKHSAHDLAPVFQAGADGRGKKLMGKMYHVILKNTFLIISCDMFHIFPVEDGLEEIVIG